MNSIPPQQPQIPLHSTPKPPQSITSTPTQPSQSQSQQQQPQQSLSANYFQKQSNTDVWIFTEEELEDIPCRRELKKHEEQEYRAQTCFFLREVARAIAMFPFFSKKIRLLLKIVKFQFFLT